MTLIVNSLNPAQSGFAAELRGVNLSQPVSAELADSLRAALAQHAVLVVRGQQLDKAAQTALGQALGLLDAFTPDLHYEPEQPRDVADKRPLAETDAVWHIARSFRPIPASTVLLHAPADAAFGEASTDFCDLRAATREWPGDPALGLTPDDLADLVVEHSLVYSRFTATGRRLDAATSAALPPQRHPLLMRRDAAGEACFFIGAHASHVAQWPLERGRALLHALNRWATQPRFVYRHRWQAGDLVLWDNYVVLNRGRPASGMALQRVTLAGAGATLPPDHPWAQAGLAHPAPGGPHIAQDAD